LKKPKNILTARRLENEFKPTSDLEFVYETPTQKYFKQLETDKKDQEVIVAKKVNELFELESNFKPLAVQNRPLCSNCHTPGHNKPMCSFPPCVSATICKNIKKHPDEEKYYKSVQSEIKAAKCKLMKLEGELKSKQESYAASINTFAARVQADLINSNPSKYLRSTLEGNKVPNWLIVNTDIRKIERIRNGKIPHKSEIQQLLKEYEEGFEVTREKSVKAHVNPVRKLWEQKGIEFPGKGIVPNSRDLLPDAPNTFQEEQSYLHLGIKESLKTNSTSSTCTDTQYFSSTELFTQTKLFCY
jgi:hypothetical protein